ncbi:MAG: RNA polymerase sigma factor [Saprospiraceae bacterium]|nr:RNA polymerase sigma factor [Saprospiraceae bacterium]
MEYGFNNVHQGLIDKSIEGDGSAQNRLYMLYSKAMYNSCLRITNDEDDAKDVLQEAFISAFKNLRSYKGNAAFGAWLKRIVVNKAINHIKKKQLETASLDMDAHDLSLDNNTEGQEINYSAEKIREAIQKLPKGYRIVFSLYLLEGYDHQEIADILGITVSTSKSQYNRAKKKLRELLTNETYGHET